MNYKLYIAGLLVAGLGLAAGLTLADGGTAVGGPSNPVIDVAPDTTPEEATLGAVASPDIQSPWVRWGGMRTWRARSEAQTTGTTTPVTLQSPSATSTLKDYWCYSTVATSSATKWTLARSATRNATTTPLTAAVSIGANNRGLAIATTSAATNNLAVLPPNTFLVWGIQGGDDTGGLNKYTPGGACGAEFLEIQ